MQHLVPGQFSGQTFAISVDFRPLQFNGTILYAAEVNDFFALFLHNGKIMFSFDFGSGSATLASTSTVMQNVWQRVSINRSGQRVQMIFRSDGAVVETARGTNTGLDVGNNLFVGGVPATTELRKEVLNDAGSYSCFIVFFVSDTCSLYLVLLIR